MMDCRRSQGRLTDRGSLRTGAACQRFSRSLQTDQLTPETPAIQLCDRFIRADANTLLCCATGERFKLLFNLNVRQMTPFIP
ncbi:hypothetical protein PN466_08725 [Roseofilum reptotaenium CS-1145]|uniref:hypothetical protein n=1 Tax=Roseofilum reptotaenium TaxID=1233427 RepID=UPI00232DDD93|nr:hypothetical protein [Roseofilum reptotaenium]MDB9517031.1 hypothetical protein [Roseofilum reptotaenium CS-1145]